MGRVMVIAAGALFDMLGLLPGKRMAADSGIWSLGIYCLPLR